MRENNLYYRFVNKYFDDGLSLRVQAFHLLAFAGTAAGIAAAAVSFATGAIANVPVNLAMSALALFFVHSARKTRKKDAYLFYYRLTVIIVFIAAFPFMFFAGGGYHSGMPCFFILALVFTALMLEKADRIAAISAEFVIYTGVCVVACFLPDTVSFYATEEAFLTDVLTGIVVSGALVLLVILLYVRIYNNRHKQLEDANKRLSELDRMKTEFLQDMRHEMQNPLTTIARGIEFAENLTGRPDKSDIARDALKLAQEESLRIGRMVESMINLATMSGGAEKREKVNFERLLVNCAETFRLQLGNRENSLNVDIDPGLPYVYGVADQLKQVLINLFQNTAKHTRNGAVTLKASCDGTVITVSVSDTGEGIAPDVLAHVFERGFSGKGKGKGKKSSGYGLSICRTIAEAHGGAINIESELGKGTAVTFTIPVYGGQSETRG